MHGEVDAEALLGAIDEFLAKSGPDIGNRKTLAVANDRSDAEGNERIPPRLDADDRLSGLICRYYGDATRRDVIAKCLGSWTRRKIVAGGRVKLTTGNPCAFIAFIGPSSSAASASRSPLATASATGGKVAMTALTASAARPS
jgi:hypothetical protein